MHAVISMAGAIALAALAMLALAMMAAPVQVP
jgi:hypothetical protein